MRRLFALLFCVLACVAEEDAVSRAVEALGRGDLPGAEQILQEQLRAQPKDGAALEVLGVVLDQEKKYAEADGIYRRALAVSSHSPSLLNNYGNHLLATGKEDEARKVFLEVIATNPRSANALVQVARMALEKKAPAEAAGYLDRVPAEVQERPDVLLLRMQADYASGKTKEADAILARISSGASSDGRQSFALGVALASVGQYERAETFFARATEVMPDNFEAWRNLGLAASRAKHYERAQTALQQALAQQGQNADVLYDLAAVDVALGQKEAALALLVRASRIPPPRAEVLQALARLSAELGYFADAIGTWNEYLKLVPGDDAARRERAFAQTAIGENAQAGLADLNLFVRKHPNDAVGHYELGMAQTLQQPELALKEFDRAIAIKPDFAGARVARGILLYRQGKPEAALADFEMAAQQEPNNGAILDRLGETYLALDRAGDALPVLRRAAEFFPANSTVLLHLGRALSKAGHTQEANAVFARCRELGPDKSASPHPAGLIDFLSLSPAEQSSRYRAGVERTVRSNPNNVEAQVRYLSILLEEGKTAEADQVTRTIAALRPSAPSLAQAVRALLKAEQYSSAKELLNKNENLARPLDRAIVNFHTVDAQAGLKELDQIPANERDGDYYLASAQMLQAENRWQEAQQALQGAARSNPTRPELYRQTAVLLWKDHHAPEALTLLEQAARRFPNDPSILLSRALALELGGKHPLALSELQGIEARWPDWYQGGLAHALVLEEPAKTEALSSLLLDLAWILEAYGQQEEAYSMEQTAFSLGAPTGSLNIGKGTLDRQGLLSALQILF